MKPPRQTKRNKFFIFPLCLADGCTQTTFDDTDVFQPRPTKHLSLQIHPKVSDQYSVQVLCVQPAGRMGRWKGSHKDSQCSVMPDS